MDFHYKVFYIVRSYDVYDNGTFEGIFLDHDNAEKFAQRLKEEHRAPWIDIEEYDVPTDYIKGE